MFEIRELAKLPGEAGEGFIIGGNILTFLKILGEFFQVLSNSVWIQDKIIKKNE